MSNPKRHIVRIQPAGAGRLKAQDPGSGSIARASTQSDQNLDVLKAERVSPVVVRFVEDKDYVVRSSDEVVAIKGGAGAATLFLPTADQNIGKWFVLKKLTTGPVVTVATSDPLGLDFIDGVASKVMNGADHACLTVVAIGQGFGYAVVSTYGIVV